MSNAHKHLITIDKRSCLSSLKCPVCGVNLYVTGVRDKVTHEPSGFITEVFIRTHTLEALCGGCKADYTIDLKENYVIRYEGVSMDDINF